MSSAATPRGPLAPRAPSPGHSPPRGVPPSLSVDKVPRGPPPRALGRGPPPGPQARGLPPGSQARGPPPRPLARGPPPGPQARGLPPGSQARGPPPGRPSRGTPPVGPPARTPPPGLQGRDSLSKLPARSGDLPTGPPANNQSPAVVDSPSILPSARVPGPPPGPSTRGTPPRGPPPRGPPPSGPPPRGPPPSGPPPRGPPPSGPPPRGPPPSGPPPKGPPPSGPPPRGPPPSGPPPQGLSPSPTSSPSPNEALPRRSTTSPRSPPRYVAHPSSTESRVFPNEDSLTNNPSNHPSLREPPPRRPPPRGPPPRGPPPGVSPELVRSTTRPHESLNGVVDQTIPPMGPPPSASPQSTLEGTTPRKESSNGSGGTMTVVPRGREGGPIGVLQPRLGAPTRRDPPRGPPPQGSPPNLGGLSIKETHPSGSPSPMVPRVATPPRTPTPPPGVPRGIPGGIIGPMSQAPQALASTPPRQSFHPPPLSRQEAFSPHAPHQSLPIEASGPVGILTVKVINGINLKAGNSLIGKADPYCNVTVGQQIWKTNVHSAGGKTPIWNEETEFQISTEKELILEVMDKESIGHDKFMRRATANISDWISTRGFRGEVTLQDANGMSVGSIQMAVKFVMLSGNTKAAMAVKGGWTSGMNGARSSTATHDSMGEFTDQEIYEAFTAFDLDKNNFVGAAEIRHVLVNIGEQATDEEVDEMIRMVDTDGDGQVSFEDFYRMVTGGKKPLPNLGGGRGGTTTTVLNGKYGGVGGNASGSQGQNMIQQRNIKKQALDEFSRVNNIKPESITKSYKRFRAEDKDSGFVEYSKFCEIMKVDPSPQCESIFRLFDHHQIGQVDMQEFLISLSNFAGGTKDDKLRFAFMVFDEDGNGVITQQELTKILKANHMAQTDAEVARKADTIMSQADKDGDGVITFDEFVVVSRRYPNIILPGGGR